MKVLIGCEESGKVRDAFSALGHDAWSNDLVPARNGGQHLQMDVFDAIAYKAWDIIILHPECTKLALSGNRWYGKKSERYQERLDALAWTIELWKYAKNRAVRGVCLENPTGVIQRSLGVNPQWIQPYQFGHGETKRTGLWLYNLPRLVPTKLMDGREGKVWRMPPGPNRKRDRSETYQGIADAMAQQWGVLS